MIPLSQSSLSLTREYSALGGGGRFSPLIKKKSGRPLHAREDGPSDNSGKKFNCPRKKWTENEPLMMGRCIARKPGEKKVASIPKEKSRFPQNRKIGNFKGKTASGRTRKKNVEIVEGPAERGPLCRGGEKKDGESLTGLDRRGNMNCLGGSAFVEIGKGQKKKRTAVAATIQGPVRVKGKLFSFIPPEGKKKKPKKED